MPSTRKVLQGSRGQKLKQTTLGRTNASPIHHASRTFSSKTASPSKRDRKRPATDSPDSHDDDLHAIKFQSKVQGSPGEMSSPRSAKKRRKTHIESDNSSSDTKLEDEQKHTTLRVNPLGKTSQTRDPSDEEEGRPLKRIMRKNTIPQLESDDEDLTDGVEKDRILDTRLRSRDRKTVFQKNLEKLKRRKQGRPPVSSSSSSGSGVGDEDTLIKGATRSSDRDSLFDEDSDHSESSGFIVEDEGTAPALLPTQFSMEAHQDLAHQFKKIFQFFVHIAVRPARERHEFMLQQIRDEEYFSVPLQVTRRKISGLRDSLVASSVWKPEFKSSLETYPEFDLIPLDFAVPVCDACHLGGRMSTLVGRLSGMAYDKLGFEIKDESDSESDSGSDGDSKASSNTPTTVEFHLGRFCGRRTRVYHQFTHWEYSLFRCILQEVDDLHASSQSGGFFRVSYSGTKEPPEDLSDADAICEWLDELKVIDLEWQKIKTMMESARHLEMVTKRDDVD